MTDNTAPLPRHNLCYKHGIDARNHVGQCSCGFACSGTYRAVRERGGLHAQEFRFEWNKWNDPNRGAIMPFNHY